MYVCTCAYACVRHVDASIVKDGRSVGCRGEASSMTLGLVLVIAIWVNGMSLMVVSHSGDCVNVYIVDRSCFDFFFINGP